MPRRPLPTPSRQLARSDHPDPARSDALVNRPGFCIRSSQLLERIRRCQHGRITRLSSRTRRCRFVLEEIEPDESRKHACERLAPKLSVKPVTLYNWVKQSAPARPARRRRRARSRSCGRRTRRCARRTVSSLGRTRSCRTRQLFSGRRSTAKGGSGVRGCAPSSRGRADLQGAAGRPVSGALGDVAAGVRPPAHRRRRETEAARGVRRELSGLWATQDESRPAT